MCMHICIYVYVCLVWRDVEWRGVTWRGAARPGVSRHGVVWRRVAAYIAATCSTLHTYKHSHTRTQRYTNKHTGARTRMLPYAHIDTCT